MKKILALFVSAAVVVSSAAAFDFSIGGHGSLGYGLGKSWADGMETATSGAYSESFDKNWSFDIGAVAELPVNDLIGLQAEVNFAVNNAGYDYKNGSLESSYKLSYNTVEVPLFVTVNLKMGNRGKSRAKFYAGPQFSWVLGDDFKAETYDNLTEKTNTSNLEVDSAFLFGIAAGGDYMKKAGPGYITAGIRYCLDFTPVEYEDVMGNVQELYTRRNLKINAGYSIPFSL